MAAPKFAQEGVHFKSFKEGMKTCYVCKKFPCVDVFPSSASYHNHALAVHELFEKKPEVKPASRKKKKGFSSVANTCTNSTKRKRGQKGTEKRSIFCDAYIRLRGDCPIRWQGTKTERRAAFERKSRTFFEMVYGPKPPMPCDNLYIEVLQRVLPLLGYKAWDSLLDDKKYEQIMKWVTCSSGNNAVHDWCQMVDATLPEEKPIDCSFEDQLKWGASKGFCRALNKIFSKKDWSLHDVRNKATPVRDCFVKGAVYFLEGVRARLLWFKNTSEEKIMERAEAAYSKWKLENKEGILFTQRQNIYYTLTTHFQRTPRQAIDEGLLEEQVIDSSNGDDAPPTVIQNFIFRNDVIELSQHVDVIDPVLDKKGQSKQTKNANASQKKQSKLAPVKATATKNSATASQASQGGSYKATANKDKVPSSTIVPDSEDDSGDDFVVPRGRVKLGQVRPQQAPRPENINILDGPPAVHDSQATSESTPVFNQELSSLLAIPPEVHTPLELELMSHIPSLCVDAADF